MRIIYEQNRENISTDRFAIELAQEKHLITSRFNSQLNKAKQKSLLTVPTYLDDPVTDRYIMHIAINIISSLRV